MVYYIVIWQKKYIRNLHDVSNLLLMNETIDRIEFENVIVEGLPKDTSDNKKDRVRRRSKD